MTGPAAITAIRAPTDLLRKEVELDAPSSASPSMRQKPPKGRMRILYSVSPLVREKIFGPMPTANSCTQMPFFFAIIKCPNSCAITRTPRSIMVINNEEMFSTSRQIYQKRTDCAYALAHASASSKSSNVYLYLTVYASIVRSISEGICKNVSSPFKKRATAISFAPFSTAGIVPPVFKAQYARERQRKVSKSGFSKVRWLRTEKSIRGNGLCTRLGYVSAY